MCACRTCRTCSPEVPGGFGDNAPPADVAVAADLVPLGEAVEALVDVAASALGVMLVVTDMDGTAISEVANPCPWFEVHGDEPGVLDSCRVWWRTMADDPDLVPRLVLGAHEFECARALVRDGDRLVAMVLAGGVAPAHQDVGAAHAAGLHHLDERQRTRLVTTLPRIAAAIASLSDSARSTS